MTDGTTEEDPSEEDSLQEDLTAEDLGPVHSGEILSEEFLRPLGVTQHRLAVEIGVPSRRINEIVHGRRAISADTALRLAGYLGISAEFFTGLQKHHDLDVARRASGSGLEAITRCRGRGRLGPLALRR